MDAAALVEDAARQLFGEVLLLGRPKWPGRLSRIPLTNEEVEARIQREDGADKARVIRWLGEMGSRPCCSFMGVLGTATYSEECLGGCVAGGQPGWFSAASFAQ